MNLFLIIPKIFIITIFIGINNHVQALEIKPTHIITDNSSIEIPGEELVWSDKTGNLKINEVIQFISEFKNPNVYSKAIESNTQVSDDHIIWHLSIIKNNSNKDFLFRMNPIFFDYFSLLNKHISSYYSIV
jgi:hypothetical protein